MLEAYKTTQLYKIAMSNRNMFTIEELNETIGKKLLDRGEKEGKTTTGPPHRESRRCTNTKPKNPIVQTIADFSKCGNSFIFRHSPRQPEDVDDHVHDPHSSVLLSDNSSSRR